MRRRNPPAAHVRRGEGVELRVGSHAEVEDDVVITGREVVEGIGAVGGRGGLARGSRQRITLRVGSHDGVDPGAVQGYGDADEGLVEGVL